MSKKLAKDSSFLGNLKGTALQRVLLLAYDPLFQSVANYGLLSRGHSPQAVIVFALQKLPVTPFLCPSPMCVCVCVCVSKQ